MNKKSLQTPGEARMPGPSYKDFILKDKFPPPEPFLEESYEFLGDQDVPYFHYTSKGFAEKEFEKMWPKTWQWACREEHIPETGDYYVYDVGHLSAIIIRDSDRKIRGYFNACMHRGTQLKEPGSSGWSNDLRCPFHGWIWNLEGELTELPQSWDFPHVTKESHKLPEVRIGTFAGFVFINFDQEAQSLEDYLGVLPDHFKEFGVENRHIDLHIQKRLPANWKAAAYAFLEAYHVRETHAGGREGTEVATQYDVFGENVSRFIHTVGSPCPLTTPPPSEQALLEKLFVRGREDEAPPIVPQGSTARDVYADIVRRQFEEKYDQSFSHVSTAQVLDSIEYFLFPNMFLFPGLSLPMVYRFRPDPSDPDHCLFDLLFLRPNPLDSEPPPPPEPVFIDVHQSYMEVEGIGRVGGVYDEDTSNLAAQTRGFKSSIKSGQTLGNYQEIRAPHLHKMIDKYLGA